MKVYFTPSMALLLWTFSRTCYNIPPPYCPVLTAAKNGAAAHRHRWLYAPRLYIICWCQTKKGNPFGKFYLPSKDIAVCLIADFDCTWDSLRKQEYVHVKWKMIQIACCQVRCVCWKNKEQVKNQGSRPRNEDRRAGLDFPYIYFPFPIPWYN